MTQGEAGGVWEHTAFILWSSAAYH